MVRYFAGLLFVALSACSSRTSSDVLQLQCHGNRVVDAQPATKIQMLYRIDLRAASLEDWDFETNKFIKWGGGRISTSGNILTYLGEIRGMNRRVFVRRELRFDRSTKKIRDQVDASWGSAMAFEGDCNER